MSRTADPKGDYVVRSVARGLHVLRVLVEQPQGLTIAEAAQLTGLPTATAFRLLKTLCSENFAEELEPGHFIASLEAARLGNSARSSSDLVGAAAGPLRRLAEETGETVNLGVLAGAKVVYLERIFNDSFVSARVRVGASLPAECTSMGKLLLAFADPEESAEALAMIKFTAGRGPNAIRSAKDLRKALAEVKERGWAMQDQELDYGLRSIAGPIHDGEGRVVAAMNLAVGAPVVSAAELKKRFLPALLRACREASGYMT